MMNKRRREGERRVGLQWVYSGSTVGLQWVYSGSTVGLQWLKDEQKTKERRTNDESIPKIRWRKIIEI